MIDNSLLTLSENAVENNVTFLKKELGEKVKISAVVKANAYGHGIEQIVPLFEKYGIEHYSVFDYSEAVRVFDNLSQPATIMIMGWLSEKNTSEAITKGIEFFVFTVERLKVAIHYAKELNMKAKIHLECETGMNRSGLKKRDLNKAIAIIKENKQHVELAGFCTHLAGAESVFNHPRIDNQLKKYIKMLASLEANGLTPNYRHVANSAAAFVCPKAKMDLVRVGIMLYGFWSSSEVYVQCISDGKATNKSLKRVLEWRSEVMAIKKVRSGEFIGYGTSYLAQTDILTALVPIGYSSGYNRSLSNKGRVIIGGQICSVIGLVNMSMIIVDISHIKDAKIGNEVVLIGKQGDSEIKVSSFSEISDELNYEILAHLSESITRTVIE